MFLLYGKYKIVHASLLPTNCRIFIIIRISELLLVTDDDVCEGNSRDFQSYAISTGALCS
jgi:hypothetical protein